MSPPAPTRRRAVADGGSGSVLVLGLVAVAVLLAGAGAVLAQVGAAASRAGSAADLAALAAADVLLGRAAGEPCAVARRVAQANGAALTGCSPAADGSVVVHVEVLPGGAAAAVGSARAGARAGPPP
jgi:secretion/DNA translocation related TadE-like protein